MMRSLGFIVWLVVMLTAGCDGSAAPAPDAAADGSSPIDGGTLTPSAPQIPWLSVGEPPVVAPTVGPCPAGFRSVATADGVEVCDPLPSTGRADCPAGSAHFPGEAGCQSVGPSCPTGPYRAGYPSGDLVFVDASAPAGGDGSSAAPYRDLDELNIGDRIATVIVLARGTYRQPLSPLDGVVIWGACAEATVIDSDVPSSTGGVVDVTTGEVSLSGVTVRGRQSLGVVARGGATLHLDGVVIEGAVTIGLWAAQGATIDGEDVVVEDVVPEAGASFGHGIRAQEGSRVSLTRVVVERARSAGVVAEDEGTEVTLSRAAIVDTLPRTTDDDFGRGAYVRRGASFELRESLVEGNRHSGVYVGGPGSSALVEDCTIRGQLVEESSGTLGVGLFVGGSAQMVARRSWLTRNHGAGARVEDAASLLTLEDFVVADTESRRDGQFGFGLVAFSGGGLVARRGHVVDNRTAGVIATEESASLDLEDVRVSRTILSDAPIEAAMGIRIERSARLSGRRLVVEDSVGGGIAQNGGDTEAYLEDVAIRRSVVVPGGANSFGHGMSIAFSRATIVRMSLSELAAYGIGLTGEGTEAMLEDVVVQDVVGAEDGQFGRGVTVQEGAVLNVERGRVERVREVGISVLGAGAEANLADVVIADVAPRRCIDSTCADNPHGSAAIATSGATLSLSRFVIDGAHLCGLHFDVADVRAHDGIVTRCEIGACIESDGYDTSRITERVAYADNATNLQTTSLPLPMPVAVAE